MNEKEYLNPDEIIGEILNAELYTLSKYLTACIEKASKLKYDTLIRRPKFQNISADTKANIFWTKCEKLELGTENCLQVFKTSSKFGGFCSDCAQGRKVVDEAKHMLNAMSWS
ncbi:unnamed protein product [Mytilus coruscus]|nr:unnamed protein product [Mytilus coruscus]